MKQAADLHTATLNQMLLVAYLERYDINAAIERVRRLLEHQFMRKVISCSVEYGPALPRIVGDSPGLQQVISNLLLNAVDALEEKEEEKRRIILRVRAFNFPTLPLNRASSRGSRK